MCERVVYSLAFPCLASARFSDRPFARICLTNPHKSPPARLSYPCATGVARPCAYLTSEPLIDKWTKTRTNQINKKGHYCPFLFGRLEPTALRLPMRQIIREHQSPFQSFLATLALLCIHRTLQPTEPRPRRLGWRINRHSNRSLRPTGIAELERIALCRCAIVNRCVCNLLLQRRLRVNVPIPSLLPCAEQ